MQFDLIVSFLLLHGHEDDPCQDDQQEDGWSSFDSLMNLLTTIAFFSKKASNRILQEIS